MPRRQDPPSPKSRPGYAATLIASAALAAGVFGTWFVIRPVVESPVPELASIAPSIPPVLTLTPAETLVAANQAYAFRHHPGRGSAYPGGSRSRFG